MKRNNYTLVAFGLFLIWSTHSQSNQLTGPEAKKRKPGEQPRKSTLLVKNHDHAPVTGTMPAV